MFKSFLFLLSFCALASALAQIDIDLTKGTINDVYVCELELDSVILLLGEATNVTNRDSILVNEYTPTHAHYADEGFSFMFSPPYIANDQKLLSLTIFLTDKAGSSASKTTSAFSGKFLPKVNLSWSIAETKHWLENISPSGGKVSITSPEEIKKLYARLPKWQQVLYFRNQAYYYGVSRAFESHSLSFGHSEHSKALEIIVIGCEDL